MNFDHLTTFGKSVPKMIVMPANNSGMEFGRLAGLFPGRIGWLISPGGWRTPPEWLPYALDNGAFGAFTKGEQWNPEPFVAMLSKTSRRYPAPRWVVVPDVVQNAKATRSLWDVWAPKVRNLLPKVPIAFAVQDGMHPSDVPADAEVVFVGGTTEWKWKTLPRWTSAFPRVHVGRVNSERMLWMAHDCKAESCDGTGWARGGPDRMRGLVRYLEKSDGPKSQLVFDLQ